MHIEQLRYLILVHRLGSIKKASEQTHLSQQALNVSMKKLEEEIGYPLFVRHARGVNLSENGRILEQAAEKILQELDDAMQKMQHEQESPAASMERLQVYSAPSVNRGFIPHIINAFSKKHPNTQFVLMEKESNKIIQMFKSEPLSAMAIVTSFEDTLALGDQYKVLPIFRDKIYVILTKSHPLSKQKTVSVRTVLKYPLAIYQNSDETANPLCDELEKYGTPFYHVVTNDLYVYENALRHKDVVGFCTYKTAKNSDFVSHTDVIILPVRNIPSLGYFVIVSKDYWAEHEATIRDFISIYRTLI